MAINIKNNFGPVIHNESGGQVLVNTDEAVKRYEQAVKDGLLFDEAEVIQDEMSLNGFVFNQKLFDTNAKLIRLRDEIGARIKGVKLADESRFEAKRPQINPIQQNEWYYLLKSVFESEVFPKNKKTTTVSVINQMLLWYPEVLGEHTEETERKDFITRLAASISAEKRKWMKGKEEVKIEDMSASCQSLGLEYDDKIQSMFFVCNDLRKALRQLKSEIEEGII